MFIIGVVIGNAYFWLFSNYDEVQLLSIAILVRPELYVTLGANCDFEDGLAGEQVSLWMYEGTLKIEYQATALSEYALHLSPDRQHIEAVKNPRRIETHFLKGTAALVADLRHGVEAFVTTTRPGAASESGQDRRAGKATPTAVLLRNWRAAPEAR